MPAQPNPYCPTDPGGPLPGRIRSFLGEVLGVSHADVRGVGIGLEAALTNTTPGTDEYRVPGDQELVVFSVQGYLRFGTLNSENTAILGWLNLDPSERWFVKAQNCLVQLIHTDRNLQMFDARAISLGAITPPVGQAMTFPIEAPYIIPSGHNLKAEFTLQDSTAAIVGSSTQYGILLTGALIAKR